MGYNTLTLASANEVAETKPSRAKLVVAAVFLVAVAGVVAFASVTSSQSVASATNAEYKALDAVPVNCDKGPPEYMLDLPRWDPEFSQEEDFYNACYYSYQFGAMCRSCLKDNSPRFVKKDCVDWLNDDSGVDTSGWVMDDLMNDNGVPQTDNEGYAVMFKNSPGGVTEDPPIDTRSCWQPRGAGDKQVVDYAEKCFEVLSWCNLCPRDTPQ